MLLYLLLSSRMNTLQCSFYRPRQFSTVLGVCPLANVQFLRLVTFRSLPARQNDLHSELASHKVVIKLALFKPVTLIVLLSSGTISVNSHHLPVFQLQLPSATLLLSTCFTFWRITLTYTIPVPGQLYDPAPAIPSFDFWRLLNLASSG